MKNSINKEKLRKRVIFIEANSIQRYSNIFT